MQITIITIVFTFIATLALTFVDFVFKSGYDYLTDISPKVNSSAQENLPNFDLGDIKATDAEGNPVAVPVAPSN